ncbi:L-proline glycine betaine ABC transport system permease protein ProW [Candidatus Rhodobacter oscarellae]|uniref:L-proline glycine betaine ABC transport system permease protein ProW n=1 Tax=Candidatus Rhodobacter oscarellae TaxID=1675527 RepID=A0A0J9EBT3_9RHOB|nr:ABC transporter permease subunit [Candidatus Rhodobacter lobularis]KMW60240.1 L-proline glycine betaine ABC transport system permease protein ProW [Candidatus Rhodobacter lobularis]
MEMTVEQSRKIGGLGITTLAGLFVAAVGLICVAIEPFAPWITAWPASLTIPASDWIGAALEYILNVIKPVARAFSAALAYPMYWTNSALTLTPWPIVIGVVVALGWYINGLRLAALGFIGFALVVASGYWTESMNTLALVAVSVPLALFVGMAIGIAAFEYRALKGPIQAVLDVMQTVPTFAYLTPLLLLFGFGPVVGLIASAIYAAPPMARNVLLGLERVDTEIREAAVMSGGNRLQQLFLVEIPAAAKQIMVGVNQCLMAALSMVIIAAVIGGFNDIGWEVLLTMRKAQFGQSLLAGLVVVVFAIVIDRMSATMALERNRRDWRISLAIILAFAVASLIFLRALPDPGSFGAFNGIAERVDTGLGNFTAQNGAALDSLKNNVVFFVLLPLRIGFDDAVLPFTWGMQWTAAMSVWFYIAAAVLGGVLAWSGRALAGALLMVLAIVLETGIAQLPWPFLLIGTGVLGWMSGGRKLSILVVVLLALILISGLWERALLSVYLSGVSVLACAVLGGAIGLLCAVSPMAWRVVRPICDMLQTIPLFVFLIPVLMFFQIGEFSAFLAICAYAIVPMIRYTQHGLTSTPPELLDAATTSGATAWQTMVEVRAPYAVPTILLGLNQTILYAFAMLVIAALIGTTGLGQSIFLALGSADVGLGITAGAAMAMLALVADRLVQGFAEERRKALGL